MLSLPSDLDALCFSLFVQCDEFDEAALLRAVFTTTELAPFAGSLPERKGSKKAFVTEVKLFLLEKRLADGRALLLPFLDTLRERYTQEDALHGELNDLYQRVLALTHRPPAQPAPQPGPKHPLDRAGLRAKLVRFFNLGELETICFDMGIEHENFQPALDQFAQDLIAYCERTGNTNELLNMCRKLRPRVDW